MNREAESVPGDFVAARVGLPDGFFPSTSIGFQRRCVAWGTPSESTLVTISAADLVIVIVQLAVDARYRARLAGAGHPRNHRC